MRYFISPKINAGNCLIPSIIYLGLFSFSLFAGAAEMAEPTPPIAEKHPHQLTLHSETRVDNYYWLRDDDRKNKKVIDYLKAENSYAESILKTTTTLQDTLYQEMLKRVNQQDQSVPYSLNGYRYQEIYQPGKEYAQYQRQREVPDAEWEVLLDANQRAQGHDYYKLGGLSVSRDNQRMAVAEDTLSRRQYSIHLKQIADKQWSDEVIHDTSGNMVWANDNNTLFYVRNHPQTLLPYQVFRHQYGTPAENDVLVYQENDDSYYLSLSPSTSRQYILINISSTATSETRLLDANQPQQAPTVFSARQTGREYYIDHFNDQFYIRSNHQHPNFGLYQTVSGEASWTTLIAPKDSKDVENFVLFRDWLVVAEREQGLTHIRKINWQSQQQQPLTLEDPTYMAWLAYNPEPDSHVLRYRYSSMTTPTSTYQWDMISGEKTLLKQQEVKNFNRDEYQSQRIWVTARDGVLVPASLVYRKSLFKKGHNPLLAYAYGAYGMSMDPSFSANRLSLLDRGFIFTLIHVRGGGELGQGWYKQGKLAKKENSFNDFIDVTQGLVQQGFGQPERLYAMGGSAGGLLVGAVINQEPTLFNAVVAQVPFVDVLTTMSDSSIPLTTNEYGEWGNPEKLSDYKVMRAYSPYDNISPKNYPNLLVTSGLHDSQVQYWEPAKWVAKLREFNRGNNIILLTTDMSAGHGGKSGRLSRLKNSAQEYAFILAMDEKVK